MSIEEKDVLGVVLEIHIRRAPSEILRREPFQGTTRSGKQPFFLGMDLPVIRKDS
jgi:hypothetical protein